MSRKRECRDCGRIFETLTEYRTHDCPKKAEKRADRIHLTDFGFTEGEGWPFVAFRVELEHGSDTMGKFNLAFSAYAPPHFDEPQFAFIDGDNQPIETIEWDEDIKEWLNAVYEMDGYTTCINYENTEYVDEHGRHGFIVLGRNLGLVYDWVEREENLPPNFRYVIPDIIRSLDAQTSI